MSRQNLDLGRKGEEEAARLLKDNGYKILFRNYKTKLGEIDIIAKDKDTLCFVEVKTRRSDRLGGPFAAVTIDKQVQIAKAAVAFLKERNLLDEKARFDVVSVFYAQDKPKLDLMKNAFELAERFSL